MLLRKILLLLFFQLVLFILAARMTAQQNILMFNELNRGQSASYLAEDHLGFMWALNPGGVHKFDGHRFFSIRKKDLFQDQSLGLSRGKIYSDLHKNLWILYSNHIPIRMDSLGKKNRVPLSNKGYDYRLGITSFLAAEKGNWLGDENGVLYYYNRAKDQLDSISQIPFYINENKRNILSICFAEQNVLYVSTLDGLLFSFNVNTRKFVERPFPGERNSEDLFLSKMKNGEVWLASSKNGIYRMRPDSDMNFKKFTGFDKLGLHVEQFLFTFTYVDREGMVWFGTDGEGLLCIDPTDDMACYQYLHDECKDFSISDNSILNLVQDRKGNRWINDKKGAISLLRPANKKIKYHTSLGNNESYTRALSVLKSKFDESLWIGTDGKGLNQILPDGTVIHYGPEKQGEYYFPGKFIQSITEDSKNNLWLGTYQRGLWHFDTKKRRFSQIKVQDNQAKQSSEIRFVYLDKKNRIWATSSLGFHLYDENKQAICSFDFSSNGLFGQYSQSICEAPDGSLWVSVNNGGLFKFIESQRTLEHSYFVRKKYYQKEKNDFSNYNIFDLKADSTGRLYIVCASGKFIKFQTQDESYSYVDQNLFGNVIIRAIQIPDANNIWLSSTNGIINYNPDQKKDSKYAATEGIHMKSFSLNCSYMGPQKKLYFGGNEGVIEFNPTELEGQKRELELYVNDIQIVNKPGRQIIPEQFELRTDLIRNLTLHATHSSFSFEYSVLDYMMGTDYYYSYLLEGFDEDWVYAGHDTKATYTNIPAGNYNFKVKAGVTADQFNTFSDPIQINIRAPWWMSNLALVIYGAIMLLIAYYIYLWLSLRSKLKKETWQKQQDKEVYDMKMQFFAKMSHEIQTPLTLILGPIEEMVENAAISGSKLLTQRLRVIKNNAMRLGNISNELSMIRNRELGKEKVFATNNHLLRHLKMIAMSFMEQARMKNIHFIQDFPEEEILIWYDKSKIEHVFYNLLANAFKFTPPGGQVKIAAKEDTGSNEIILEVSDSGPGIPEKDLKNIFKLFYRASDKRNTKGMGIGLALTKEMILLHKGRIDVQSSKDTGTIFTIRLLLGEDVFPDDQKLGDESTMISLAKAIGSNEDVVTNNVADSNPDLAVKKYKVLVVEDNLEMQVFLKNILQNHFTILLANNGKEGLDLALKESPDAIVSDIKMPEMDGLTMCSKLQGHAQGASIPVILISSEYSSISKIEALKSGAMGFILKPFNSYELLLKIQNILAVRDKSIENYKKELAQNPDLRKEASKNDLFLEEIVKILNDEMDNSEFKLEELTDRLKMSYSAIYRKCMEITGLTLVELVRSLKMKKALVLISKKAYNVSEAAFMVGYKDTRYFSKCFKEEFGMQPMEFKKMAREGDISQFLEDAGIHPILMEDI